jgi:phenylalanyl-tRNA synthetase alpha chain
LSCFVAVLLCCQPEHAASPAATGAAAAAAKYFCSYSSELGKWMEVGNSGMFRPEMLQPMGLPPDVNVIAWGLSLERPTMILYGIDNIRDLFGHKVSLSMVKSNPICRMGL